MLRRVFKMVVCTMSVACMALNAESQTKPETKGIEFRIDTDVYVDESKPPVASTKTLFLRDRVIECDDAKQRAMMLEYSTQQIVLVDLANHRSCRIEMASLESKLSSLKSQMTPEQTKAWASSELPKDAGNGYEVIQSDNLKYQFKTSAPRREEFAIAYSEFADWSVRVNAVYPPYKPPLLRMQLNQYLGEQRKLPIEVRLTDLRSKNATPVVARVLVQEMLSRQDQERIKNLDALVASLKFVTDQDFFQIPAVASTKPQSAK
ncbi:MAG: hypothetical protein ACK5O8_08535 [Pirellula sp.]|jgi:hypothetical protein